MAGSDRDMVDSIPSPIQVELKWFSIVQQGHSNCFFSLQQQCMLRSVAALVVLHCSEAGQGLAQSLSEAAE